MKNQKKMEKTEKPLQMLRLNEIGTEMVINRQYFEALSSSLNKTSFS